MSEEERAYWFALNAVDGLGPARFALLRAHFTTAKAVWDASSGALAAIGIPQNTLRSLEDTRQKLDPKKYLQTIRGESIHPLTLLDEVYPPLLKQIPDPPFVLFVRGSVKLCSSACFAVVGTRRISAYGRHVTAQITRDLSLAGLTIVSGLAYGVDAAAHRATLEAGGKTIAVLGCGVDCIYPKRHEGLAQAILRHGGAIVAEAALSRWVTPGVFPARNRIISGLSLGVLVTEAASRSGSLITARLALEQGRDVFAVPGPITSLLSAGTTALLKQGAAPVSAVDDILETLPGERWQKKSGVPMLSPETKEERVLYAIVGQGQASLDDLVERSGLSSSVVASTLSMMELKGLVQSFGDGTYGIAAS